MEEVTGSSPVGSKRCRGDITSLVQISNTHVMNIYFAASIRAGRGDVFIYKKILPMLQKHGTVLTAHVADEHVSSEGETGLSDQQIFSRDMAWLRSADVLIAEVSIPSLGVGYEIGQARSMNIPVLCLYRAANRKKLSGMISGDPEIHTICYREAESLQTRIDNLFQSLHS